MKNHRQFIITTSPIELQLLPWQRGSCLRFGLTHHHTPAINYSTNKPYDKLTFQTSLQDHTFTNISQNIYSIRSNQTILNWLYTARVVKIHKDSYVWCSCQEDVAMGVVMCRTKQIDKLRWHNQTRTRYAYGEEQRHSKWLHVWLQ